MGRVNELNGYDNSKAFTIFLLIITFLGILGEQVDKN